MFGEGSQLLHAIGWALINSLWQMALLWVIYQFITGMRLPVKSSGKSWLASSLLLIGFGWFLFTFFSYYFNPGTGNFSFLFPASASLINKNFVFYLPVISLIYLLLFIVRVHHFIRNYRYVYIIRRFGKIKIDIDWRIFVRKTAQRMGITKPVHIWISEFVSSPVTIGFLKPIILIPFAAMNQLTTRQMEAVLLHELSHIKRCDYLVNLLINCIQTILYFNPFVKAFVKIVEREREKSCDELVLQFQYDSYDYAAALLTLEKTSQEYKFLTLASGGHKNDLLHRIETILKINPKNIFPFKKLAAVAASILLITGMQFFYLNFHSTGTNDAARLSFLSEPLQYMSGGIYEKANDPIETLRNSKPAFLNTKNSNPGTISMPSETSEEIAENPDPGKHHSVLNDIIPVTLKTILSPGLDKSQEYQVKEAMEASRKVLENAQWKLAELNIAEVFTEKEKEKIKAAYHNEVSKFDWKNWENQLRLAYTNVDWDKVNYQLSNAVNQIKIDSLQKVLNNKILQLDEVKKELSENGVTGIPDTDITVKVVEKKKLEALKTINNLRSIRNKKVVHL